MDPRKILEESVFVSKEAPSHRLSLLDVFRLSFRVFRVKPLRTVLTILGISVGIGVVLFLVSLGYGLQFILVGKLASTEDSLISIEAYYPDETNLTINREEIDNVSSFPEAAEVSPVGEFPGESKYGEISSYIIMKLIRTNYFRLAGLTPDFGKILSEGDKDVVVSVSTLKLLGLSEDETSIGKEINISVFFQKKDSTEVDTKSIPYPIKIKGIVNDELSPPFILIPDYLLDSPPPYYQKIFVKAKDINSVEKLRDQMLEKGFLISAKLDLVRQARNIMSIITIVLGVFGVTALVVSAIGMFNTMVIGFLERVFEIGIMKSIGATSQDIRNLFLMESLIMGLMGGAGGIIVGIGSAELFNFALNFLAGQLGGKPLDLFIYPTRFLVFIMVLSGLVGILSGFWPARRAASLSPRNAFARK
ncbi:ABC transporter permease [Candidatus Giovannonibacteria bacterium]|nr:ABC transporter permease [Candidatus Giovannonibacteria bacterium]